MSSSSFRQSQSPSTDTLKLQRYRVSSAEAEGVAGPFEVVILRFALVLSSDKARLTGLTPSQKKKPAKLESKAKGGS